MPAALHETDQETRMSSTLEATTPVAPWYRQRWPWLLTIPPVAAVLGCAVTITLAIMSNDGLVTKDYYRRGLEINQQLARDEQARTLGLQATISARGVSGGDAVLVRLAAQQPVPPEASISVRLVHPGRSGADRSAVLARHSVADDGRSVEYVGNWADAAPVSSGVAWRVVIDAREWRMDGDASMLARNGSIMVDASK
jgi:uncharacterized protein